MIFQDDENIFRYLVLVQVCFTWIIKKAISGVNGGAINLVQRIYEHQSFCFAAPQAVCQPQQQRTEDHGQRQGGEAMRKVVEMRRDMKVWEDRMEPMYTKFLKQTPASSVFCDPSINM